MALVDVDDTCLDYAELREDPAQNLFCTSVKWINIQRPMEAHYVEFDLRYSSHEKGATEYCIVR